MAAVTLSWRHTTPFCQSITLSCQSLGWTVQDRFRLLIAVHGRHNAYAQKPNLHQPTPHLRADTTYKQEHLDNIPVLILRHSYAFSRWSTITYIKIVHLMNPLCGKIPQFWTAIIMPESTAMCRTHSILNYIIYTFQWTFVDFIVSFIDILR
jgi:hypothetical protein